MRNVWAIALNTFKEAVRDHILYSRARQALFLSLAHHQGRALTVMTLYVPHLGLCSDPSFGNLTRRSLRGGVEELCTAVRAKPRRNRRGGMFRNTHELSVNDPPGGRLWGSLRRCSYGLGE